MCQAVVDVIKREGKVSSVEAGVGGLNTSRPRKFTRYLQYGGGD